MQSITINIANNAPANKALHSFERFRNDALKIPSKEDLDDLKILKATRGEDSIPFDEYLKDERQYS